LRIRVVHGEFPHVLTESGTNLDRAGYFYAAIAQKLFESLEVYGDIPLLTALRFAGVQTPFAALYTAGAYT
jgi:hypothetical protein